jgi:hypothetical protein
VIKPWHRSAAGALVAGVVILAAAGVAGADKRDDQRFVAKTVLVAADVPAGYAEQPVLKPGLPGGKVCKAVRAALQRQEKAPNSASYFRGGTDSGTIIDLVTLLPTEATAEKVLAAYASPEAGRCIARELDAAYAPARKRDASLEVTVDVQPTAPGIGDESTGWRSTITLANNEGRLVSTNDVVVVRVGRGVARFDFGAPSTGVLDQPAMIQTVVDRLGAQP